MIVKIWPINADHRKDPTQKGGVKGLTTSLHYVFDEKKTHVKQGEMQDVPTYADWDDSLGECFYYGGNIRRVIDYMAEEDKTESQYVSGYCCNPTTVGTVVADFTMNKMAVQMTAHKEGKKETGAVAFHIVQSFPADLDISSEEVHQCGIELVEKIGKHQAVICSHVNPVVDEEHHRITGKCKHNHILINAYVRYAAYDPQYLKRIKYNDCKDTYRQLRIWNDEIALDHGLPIIRNPDDDRTYSWFESAIANHGLSRKERVRADMDEARHASSNWQEYVQLMEAAGYTVKEGVHTTYTTPDGVHKIRDHKLGNTYTRESMELFWGYTHNVLCAVEDTALESEQDGYEFLEEAEWKSYTVGVPLGDGVYHLPLRSGSLATESVESYFDEGILYDVYDEEKHPIATVWGDELIAFLERDSGKEDMTGSKEAMRQKRYFTGAGFRSKSGNYYRTNLFDEYGQRRTLLELILILALTVLKKEEGVYVGNSLPDTFNDRPIYLPVEKKVQMMIDYVYMAREEEVETPKQLDVRLREVGAKLSRANYQLRGAREAELKMRKLYDAVVSYRQVQPLAERIQTMVDCEYKRQLQNEYAGAIEQYKASKAVLYRYRVTEQEEMEKVEAKYKKVVSDIAFLETLVENQKQTYRRLKQIQYGVDLAQNPQFCYGPGYEADSRKNMQRYQERGKERGR